MELNDFQFWAEWWSSTIPVDTHISANSASALFKRSANWPRLNDLYGVTYFFVTRAQQNYSAPPRTTSCFWRSFPTLAEMTDLMVSSSFLPAALYIYVVRESNQSLFFKRQNESMKLHFMEVKWQHLQSSKSDDSVARLSRLEVRLVADHHQWLQINCYDSK